MGQGPGDAPKRKRTRTPVFSMSFWKSSLHLEDREVVVQAWQGFAQAGQSLPGFQLFPTLRDKPFSGQSHPLQAVDMFLGSIAPQRKESSHPSTWGHLRAVHYSCCILITPFLHLHTVCSLLSSLLRMHSSGFSSNVPSYYSLQTHTPHTHPVSGVCLPHSIGSS